jgi:antitoxin YefM
MSTLAKPTFPTQRVGFEPARSTFTIQTNSNLTDAPFLYPTMTLCHTRGITERPPGIFIIFFLSTIKLRLQISLPETKMVIIMTLTVTIKESAMQTIETYIPITQAKAKLLDMVRQLGDTNDTIAITKNGVPEAVLLSMKKFEGFLETIDILSDPEMMKQLRGSAADIKEGKLVDLDQAF